MLLPKIFTLLIGSILMIGCTGCEGNRCASGLIKDQVTNAPIDSVEIFVVDVNETKFTDTSGRFSACSKLGSCMFGCKDINLQFMKKGYKARKVTNPDVDAVILMERE